MKKSKTVKKTTVVKKSKTKKKVAKKKIHPLADTFDSLRCEFECIATKFGTMSALAMLNDITNAIFDGYNDEFWK